MQPIFDYADLVWGDKDNASLMKELQILQNKAAKLILDRSLHSSSTDALTVLRWLNLKERRKCHRCIMHTSVLMANQLIIPWTL